MAQVGDTARISLDVDFEQKAFLKQFAAQQGISSSVILRAVIYKLEVDPDFAQSVLDEIFYVEDEIPDEILYEEEEGE